MNAALIEKVQHSEFTQIKCVFSLWTRFALQTTSKLGDLSRDKCVTDDVFWIQAIQISKSWSPDDHLRCLH